MELKTIYLCLKICYFIKRWQRKGRGIDETLRNKIRNNLSLYTYFIQPIKIKVAHSIFKRFLVEVCMRLEFNNKVRELQKNIMFMQKKLRS